MAKENPESFEVRNKGGQTTITVYPLKSRPGFVFRYYLAGKSRTVERVDREKIVAEALRIAKGIDAGLDRTGTLTAADMESYVHARDQLPPGSPPLHAIVAEWVAFRREIGATPLSEVLATWKRAGRRHAAGGAAGAATVERLSVEFLAILATQAAHAGTRRNLEGFRADLPRFGKTFGHRPIADLHVGEMERWIRELGVGARRQDNLREKLVTFFRWARERGHLDEERKTEPEKIGRVYKRGEVEYWRPGEVRKLLAAVDPKWLPCMALAAFAGMRISEIGRLDWTAFDWEARRIYVRTTVALKTGRSRRIPLEENLVAWLLPLRKETGRLYDYANPSGEWTKETERLETKLGIKWRANNLRHAYGSYQMALIDNYNQVSAWMGNSPGEVQSSYDGVATPTEAKEWFSIQPDGARKVVPMRAAE